MVIATSVAFWRRQTGAQQRIYSLVSYLQAAGFGLRIALVGGWGPEDKQQLEFTGLAVEYLSEHKEPRGGVQHLLWHLRGTVHLLGELARGIGPGRSEGPSAARSLDQFASKRVGSRFRTLIDTIRPSAVIVEFLSLSYLADWVSADARKATRLLIDTHDLMHLRNRESKACGYPHWLELTRRQETAALAKFDCILAIQDGEAEDFRRLVPATEVLVVGHPMQIRETEPPEKPPKEVRVGYLGSDNDLNYSALARFVEACWPRIRRQARGAAELLIGGGICKRFAGFALPEGIRLLGAIESTSEFYRSVAIVVNPTRSRTGLKIKNVEALANGKCLITTIEASAGLPARDEPAWLACNSDAELIKAAVSLIDAPSARRDLENRALVYAEKQLAPARVFSELIAYLRRRNRSLRP